MRVKVRILKKERASRRREKGRSEDLFARGERKNGSGLHLSIRHLMGEELDSLSNKELQHLEHQLESSLKHIRSRKTDLMLDSIDQLQNKEKMLKEQKKNMEEIIAKEKAKVLAQNTSCEQQQQSPYNSSRHHHLISDSIPTHISRNCQQRSNEEEASQAELRLGNGLLPPWMLNHLKG